MRCQPPIVPGRLGKKERSHTDGEGDRGASAVGEKKKKGGGEQSGVTESPLVLDGRGKGEKPVY